MAIFGSTSPAHVSLLPMVQGASRCWCRQQSNRPYSNDNASVFCRAKKKQVRFTLAEINCPERAVNFRILRKKHSMPQAAWPFSPFPPPRLITSSPPPPPSSPFSSLRQQGQRGRKEEERRGGLGRLPFLSSSSSGGGGQKRLLGAVCSLLLTEAVTKEKGRPGEEGKPFRRRLPSLDGKRERKSQETCLPSYIRWKKGS